MAGVQAAFLVTATPLEISPALGFAALALSISAVLNLHLSLAIARSRSARQAEILAILLFDAAQISLLALMTGGLSSPLAMCMLFPVIIATLALGIRLLAVVHAGAAACLASAAAFGGSAPSLAQEAFIVMPAGGAWTLLPFLLLLMLCVSACLRKLFVDTEAMGQGLLASQETLYRQRKLIDISGIIVATAHELNSPLATIKLVSKELASELKGRESLQESAALICEQAERCARILVSMEGAKDISPFMKAAPLEAVAREAAEPYMGKEPRIQFLSDSDSGPGGPHPEIPRLPEIVHGLRNVIQNAAAFADKKVLVVTSWTPETICVRIEDDGSGFPPNVIERIGVPFLKTGKNQPPRRENPGYQGMGLGLFIAKTLLERTGARIRFSNLAGENGLEEAKGACVTIEWDRGSLAGAERA